MYKELKRTYTAMVLLMKPFVLWRSRSRCRSGLLKYINTTRRETQVETIIYGEVLMM